MEEDSLISIIVPIYDVERYLNKCVDSIINQTYKNIEIIVVDDGSPDNCGKICDEYAKKDSRIKVIHKQIKNNVINFIDDVEGEKFSKKQISKCYEIRSAYVHGNLTIKREQIEKSLDIIDEICRRVFIKIYSDVNIYKAFISNDNNKVIEYLKF